MKVKNTAIYMGQDERVLRRQAAERAPRDQKTGNFFVGGLFNGQTDKITMRKQMAQKKAFKIVQDTFAAEQKLDMDQDLRREQVKDLKQQLRDTKEELAAQDLSQVPEEELTEEMKEQHDEAVRIYTERADQLENQIEGLNMAIRDTKLERLKKDPMVKASKEADAIMEAAGDEVLGMLIAEAKDHIDEEQEKREEQAEKIEEKKEAEEELIEKKDEREEELKELTESIQDPKTDGVQKEIEEMMEQLKLIEEDLKGAKVDTKL